ncbi:MAG: Flp1 family type IVb pilin [Lachnospiraceae bacterium]
MYLKNRLTDIFCEKRGVGVVEVILILVVLIGLVIIFKSQLTSLVQNIFKKIVSDSSGI